MAIDRFKGDYQKLQSWVKHEYEIALANHGSREARYKAWQRIYDAKPLVPYRVWPWAGASNIEVPLAKTHTATVDSRIEDAYFTSEPLMHVRSNTDKWRDHCQALQDWNNQVELPNAQYSIIKKHSILSTTKFGSSFNFLQWKRLETRVGSAKNKLALHHDGPMLYYIHPNNILFPSNTLTIPYARWIAFRSFKSWNELISEFYEGHYSRSVIHELENQGQVISDPFDTWKNYSENRGYAEPQLWEIVTMFCYYQEDPFELPHNLWVTFHYPSAMIMEAFYNPLKHYGRPLFKADYMIEDGNFLGIGIPGMLEMLQTEISDFRNYRNDNIFLANTTMFAGKKSFYDKFDIAPMAEITTYDDPDKVISFIRPGEIYPSSTTGDMIANADAERLTGVGDSNIPRMSSFRGAAGVRTPATTTLALIGEGNKRFTVAINNAKESDNEMLKQLLQLEHQFWQRRKSECYAWNPTKAKRIDELFNNLSYRAFTRNIVAEVGASTATLNKETERQNIVIITNEIIIPIFNYLIQLNTMLKEFPDMGELISKAYNSTIAWAIRALETFDVRDPEQYLPKRTDVGTAQTTADAAQRTENFGTAFVEQALRNSANGSFANGGGQRQAGGVR